MITKNNINSAGGIFALFTDFIAIYTGWTLYDNISATSKVYKNTNDNQNFYLFINDANSAYAIFNLWENWDSGVHSGSGNTTGNLYCQKRSGTTCMVGDDVTFIIYCDTADAGYGAYVGFIDPYDVTDTKAICCSSGASSLAGNSQMFLPNHAIIKFLFGKGGASDVGGYCSGHYAGNASYNSVTEKLYINRIAISDASDGYNIRGYAKYAYLNDYILPTGFAVGGTLTIEDKLYKLNRVPNYMYYCFLLYE